VREFINNLFQMFSFGIADKDSLGIAQLKSFSTFVKGLFDRAANQSKPTCLARYLSITY